MTATQKKIEELAKAFEESWSSPYTREWAFGDMCADFRQALSQIAQVAAEEERNACADTHVSILMPATAKAFEEGRADGLKNLLEVMTGDDWRHSQDCCEQVRVWVHKKLQTKCGCGEPWTGRVIHRTDAPCYWPPRDEVAHPSTSKEECCEKCDSLDYDSSKEFDDMGRYCAKPACKCHLPAQQK